MTIHVTQAHIDNGTAKSCEFCPVAEAVREDSGVDCVVSSIGLTLFPAGGKPWVSLFLPSEAKRFIRSFDRGLPVEPFSFELDYEPEGAGGVIDNPYFGKY